MTASVVESDKDVKYVKYLENLKEQENMGALAALRRGLGKDPGLTPEMHPYVVPWLGDSASMAEERAYYLVASLFAWYKLSPSKQRELPQNLGASLRQIWSGDNQDALEKRFVAMLNCHADDLAEHLRQVIGLLHTKDVPINWVRLLKDVKLWNKQNRFVQRRWAKAFWVAGRKETQENQPTKPTGDGDE